MSEAVSDIGVETREGARLRFKKRAVDRLIDVVLFAFSILMILPLIFLVSNAFKTPAEMLAWTEEQIARAHHGNLFNMLGREQWPAILAAPEDGTNGSRELRELRRLYRLHWPAEDEP